MVALNEADLQPLSMKELMNLTDEHGVAEHLVDSAMDADDPKEELIKLLCGGKPAGGKPTRKNGKPLFNGTRVDGWGKAAMCKAAATVDNDRDAQYWLGRRFVEGRTVKQDERQGVIWLRKAAAAGSYPAQCYLGKHFQRKLVNHDMVATGGKYGVSKQEAARQAKRAKALARAEAAEREQNAHVAQKQAAEEAKKQAEIAAQKAAVEAAEKKAAEDAAANEAAAAAKATAAAKEAEQAEAAEMFNLAAKEAAAAEAAHVEAEAEVEPEAEAEAEPTPEQPPEPAAEPTAEPESGGAE